MAKKTVSFSLEDDLIEIIDNVQKSKKLSSRSSALERILIHFQYVTKNTENFNSEDISKHDNMGLSKDTDESNDFIHETIKEVYDNIPE